MKITKNSEIMVFLMDKNLLNNIVKAVQETGVVGEVLPIKAEIVICVGKLVTNKHSISTNLHPEDETSAGKDHVTEHVMMIVFYKDWIKYNSPTPTAISYGQRKEKVTVGKDKDGKAQVKWKTFDKELSKDKIIYIKDASNNFLNGDDCKLLLEEENVDTPKTVNNAVVHLKWKKPVVIITTADTTTDHQVLRRLPSLPLNSTKEQTKSITEYQLDHDCDIFKKKKQKNNELINTAKKSFYQLKSIIVDLKNVRDYIEKQAPKCNDVIMRSLFPRLLDYIKFSTALHQFQREKNDREYYFATKQDVDIGLEIFNYMYQDDLIDISLLNKRQRNILKKLKQHSGEYFTISQIHLWKESGGVSIQQLYSDIRAISRADSNVKLYDEKQPKQYGYENIVIKPVETDDEEDFTYEV